MKSYFKKEKEKLKGAAWKRRRKECFERDNYICRECGKQHIEGENTLSPHHIKFKSQGGDDSLDNLVSLCTFPCHRLLHDGKIKNVFD